MDARPTIADTGPADPRQAWVGVYRGTYDSIAFDCTTSAPLDTAEPHERTRPIIIDASGRLVVDLPCPIPLELTGEWTARVPPFECDSTLPDGSPVHAEYSGGSAELIGGDELWMETRYEVEHAGGCDDTADNFAYGTRID